MKWLFKKLEYLYVENKNIWLSVDESTDAEGRYVWNVVIGTWN